MTQDANNSGVAVTVASTHPGTSSGPGHASGDGELAPGTTIGEYVISGKLGEGGFGVVYCATHPVIGKQVAIKILNRAFSIDPGMVSRFIAEARAVNQIRHRNIIDIFSFGQLPDLRQYYVMELLSGVPLDSYLREHGGRMSPEAALPVLRAVARALDAAHAKGIAHRDLKPENVFIADDDGAPFPKLLDFGIAKLMADDGAAKHKTRTGAPMGTPTYMSPEQCRGRDVDHRTDIYSFGIMTYQLLTGVLPFRGDDFVELLMQQVQATAAPPSRVCPELPAALDAPILHMMEKDAARRPVSVTAAVDAMCVAVGIPVPVSRGTAPHRAVTPPFGVRADATPAPRAASVPGSLIAAEAFTAPKKRARMFLAVAGAAVAAGAVATAIALTSGGGGPQTAAAPPPSAAPPPAPAVAAVVAPAPPPPPSTVEIAIHGAPEGTQVYATGHVLLATLPSVLVVKRGDAPFEITLEHAGFVARTERITVAASATLELALQPEPKPVIKPARTSQPKPKPAKKKSASNAEIPDDEEVWR